MNGEPFGELGLASWDDHDWAWDHDHNYGWGWPYWWNGTNPGLDVEGAPTTAASARSSR